MDKSLKFHNCVCGFIQPASKNDKVKFCPGVNGNKCVNILWGVKNVRSPLSKEENGFRKFCKKKGKRKK